MKKILILGLFLLPTLSYSSIKPAVYNISHKEPESKCEYTVQSGLDEVQSFVKVRKQVLQVSLDGKQTFTGIILHNPKSADKDSIDGMVIYVEDKRLGDKALILMVGYDVTPTKRIIYSRKMVKTPSKAADGTVKELVIFDECFTKTITQVPALKK